MTNETVTVKCSDQELLTEGAVEFVGTTDDLHTSVNGDGPIGPSAILLHGHVDNHISQYFLGHLCQADG